MGVMKRIYEELDAAQIESNEIFYWLKEFCESEDYKRYAHNKLIKELKENSELGKVLYD